MLADATVREGLKGVVVTNTELSLVDGARGELVVRGMSVEALFGHTFEDACHLVWTGRLPEAHERDCLARALGDARVRAFAHVPTPCAAWAMGDAMDGLRAAVAALALPSDVDQEARNVTLVGAVAVFAAAWARIAQGEALVAPDARLSHAADFLRMVHGTPQSRAAADALDAYLCTVVDHGMNASTFAARVVASTESDDVSAITAAIGALKGRLHGGAPGPVLDMLDAIGEASRARAYLAQELDAGRRIMGMGHRVYRVRDPRAAVLERAVERLERAEMGRGRLELARAVEREAEALLAERHPERRLRANVEFFTAVLLEALGLPRTLFTATFAVGRVAGWCAHVAEQRRAGTLIRPESRYVGPMPAAS